MSRIKILPENLANQIAAGEVVERPASVVKELVENALDAGATHIAVQVEGAGTRMLRVIDNGCGMDPDDALLCLERHATSKLKGADDLIHIRTLGFRGEAIPSIASVSRLSITSRPAGAALGCRVDVRFGSVHKVHEMGCAQGTVVEVADLFANVPARRKFLKSANTELAHIDEIIRSYALISFRTGFSYQVNGRDLLDLPASDGTEERRVRQLLADTPELITVVADAEGVARPEIRVTGFLVPPEQASGRAGRLWTFVNGRYIKDRLVNHAVAEGMSGFLMRGGRPAGVIHLHLPPAGVDVNVHPTKQEVRFSEGNLVHNKIVAAIWRSMEAYQTRLKGEIFGPARKEETPPVAEPCARQPGVTLEVREPEPRSTVDAEGVQAPAVVVAATAPGVERKAPAARAEGQRPSGSGARGASAASGERERPLPERGAAAMPGPSVVARPGPVAKAKSGPMAMGVPGQPPPLFQGNARLHELLAAPPALPATRGQDPSAPAPVNANSQERCPLPGPERSSLRYLGQLFDSYLLCQAEDGLVAIDQHAVQERLIFEELKGHYHAGTMPGQILMFPAMVELLPAEVEAVAQHGPELQRLGLELQEFGGDTVVIKAVPAGLGHLPPADILRGVLSRFLDEQPLGHESAQLDEVLAGMACKAAIKAGHALTPVEVKHLLARIQRAGIFSHCPHGRSVVKRFSRAEIERWFQRG